jgi:16S rRNA (cytosine967-C5)-methyltransferase
MDNSGLPVDVPSRTRSEVNLHRLAFDVVARVLSREGFASFELYKLFKPLHLPPVEKQVVFEDVWGMLGNLFQVDFLLRQYTKLNMQNMPLEVLNFLRFSAFLLLQEGKSRDQLQSVASEIGTDFAGKYGGFIDRVMNFLEKNAARILAEDLESLPVPEQLAVKYSFPKWVVALWLDHFGPDLADQLCRASITRPPQDLRVNVTRQTVEDVQELLWDEKIDCRAGNIAPHALTVPNGMEVFKTRAFKEKFIEVQDQGSQLVTYLVDPQPDDIILDYCAGTGGKTLQLAGLFALQAADDQIRVYASDISPGKLSVLSRRVNRAYNPPTRVKVVQQPNLPPKAELVAFTKFLVDAPCSGLGNLRRNPGIKATATPTDAAELVAKQAEILNDVAALARPGARIIYVTCTIDPAENEEQVASFAAAHTDFEVLPYRETLSPANPILAAPVPTHSFLDDRFFMLYPPLTGTDGFFGAILQKL